MILETMETFEVDMNNTASFDLPYDLDPDVLSDINESCNNFSCVNLTLRGSADIMLFSVTKAVFYIEYMTIFLLGIFGNCLVCYVVFRNKHMRTVTNFFIANLALADILLCVLAVPFTPLYFFMKEWVFGRVLCHFFAIAQGTSVYVSSLTLTSIAIDRFFVILYPFRPRLRLQTCYIVIIGIWLFSISTTLPYAFYMGLEVFQDKYYCEELWPSDFIRQMFGVFTVIMQFAVPFIIILFCYVKISIRMNDRVRSKPGSKSSKKEEADRERKKRTNRMLIAMVTIFGLSWSPLNIVNLVGDCYAPASHWAYYNFCFFVTHVIAMSSTCYNPFLYAWLNENFRNEFHLVLPCFYNRRENNRDNQLRAERTCNGNNTQQELLAADRTLAQTSPTPASNNNMEGPSRSGTSQQPSGSFCTNRKVFARDDPVPEQGPDSHPMSTFSEVTVSHPAQSGQVLEDNPPPSTCPTLEVPLVNGESSDCV